MSENKFFFGRAIENINKLKRELPILLANQARLHFTGSFREQGYEGRPWKEPNRKIEGTPEYKYPKNKGLGRRTQTTLIRTGRLRRDVNSSVRVVSFERIELIVSTPYAAYLNEGTEHMPARPFVKDSPLLRKMQVEKIEKYIDKVWQE